MSQTASKHFRKSLVEEALHEHQHWYLYFEPEVLEYIPSGQEYDIGSQLFPS